MCRKKGDVDILKSYHLSRNLPMDGYFIGVDKCRMHQAFHRFLCPLVTGHVAIYVWPMALVRTPWTKAFIHAWRLGGGERWNGQCVPGKYLLRGSRLWRDIGLHDKILETSSLGQTYEYNLSFFLFALTYLCLGGCLHTTLTGNGKSFVNFIYRALYLSWIQILHAKHCTAIKKFFHHKKNFAPIRIRTCEPLTS